MKSKLLCILLLAFAMSSLNGQHLAERAFIDAEGKVSKESLIIDVPDANRIPGYGQLPAWPKKVVASPNFKNFRGVTLADVTGNGTEDILVAGHNRLQAFSGNGNLIWSKNLTGTAIYPPSVADMDGNGTMRIVQVTGGVPNNGRVYLMDLEGNDQPGWPLSFENHWIICAPVLADISGDGVREIIVQTRTSDNLHVLKTDGSPLNANWPVNLGGTPAITPSVADIDNNGSVEIITGISNGTLYAFDGNGNAKAGFPVPPDNYSFSYQSPLLVDFDGTDMLSIVGSTHGNAPKFYARDHSGNYRSGWPVAVPGNYWTYSPPTIVDFDGNNDFSIFMSRPTGEDELPMLYGFHPDGSMMDHFPIVKSGGLEGFISIVDINGNGQHDLVFGSNLMVDGQGFIHAWSKSGEGQLPGFPLRPIGFTFMNGANLGDVNGDGMLNLVALSYELNFDPADSTFINVYDLQIPVDQADVLFGTYKGSNDRSGFVPRSVEGAFLEWIPTTYDFGEMGVGYSSDTVTFTLVNTGNESADISSITLIGDHASDFVLIDDNSYPIVLEPDASIEVGAAFIPLDSGEKSAGLFVETDVEVAQAQLNGTAIDVPGMLITPDALYFLDDFLTDVLYIQNTGTAELIYEIDIQYETVTNWIILSDSSGIVLPNGEDVISVSISLENFLEAGTYEAVLLIAGNDPNNPETEVPVTFIFTVGLEETTTLAFEVFPNPAGRILQIKMLEEAVKLRMINPSGLVVGEWQLTGDKEIILETAGFSSGLYIIQMEDTDGKLHNRRLIIQH